MARISTIDETKPRSKSKAKASKTNNVVPASSLSSPSATAVIVLGVLSSIIGLGIHIKATRMSPDKSMAQLMTMSLNDFRKHLNLSKSWPGTQFFDNYTPAAFHYFLMLITVFKEICINETGRGILLLVSNCIAPFCTFLAIEGLKDGKRAGLSITTLVLVTSLGQVICIGSAMPLVMGPLYAYTRWSEVKRPDYVFPSPSPSQFRVTCATIFSIAALSTFFPTIFLPVNHQYWVMSNIAFQFFPLAWLPLVFFSTKANVISKPASASARQEPRLFAAQAYRMSGYFSIFIYYMSLYYGYPGFLAAYRNGGDWKNEGHYVLFWDGIGCLVFNYLIVLIDSYVDEAKVSKGAKRIHFKRFLPEDVIMGLPGILILGPGWAMSTYFQR